MGNRPGRLDANGVPMSPWQAAAGPRASEAHERPPARRWRRDAATSRRGLPSARAGLAGVLATFLAAVLMLGAPARAAKGEAASCPAAFGAPVAVTAIDRFGDIVLADGTVVALAGLAVEDGEAALAARRASLAAQLGGREVTLAGPAATDRYGRRRALLRLAAPREEDGADATVQVALLRQGLALARPEAGFLGCMNELRAAEAPARRAKRGLWAGLPLPARDEKTVTAKAGRFTILAGRVLSVGNGRRVDYLNFGPVWRQDTTVRLEKPVRVALERAGLSLEALAGRAVAVRGVVFEADGPAIDVRWIEQIEFIDGRMGQGQAGNW